MMNESQMKDVQAAKRAINQGAVEIWSVRLQLLREHGDFKQLLEHLKSPVESADTNAGCNGNCWCGAPGPDLVDPSVRGT